MFKHFSIADLLLVTCLAAVLVFWWPNRPSPYPGYNDLLLRYSDPEVPAAFDDNGREPPNVSVGSGGYREYSNGADLYQSEYRYDWNCVITDFINEREYWRDAPDDSPKLGQLAGDTWTVEHLLYAGGRGRLQALRQMDRFLANTDEQLLRSRLKQHPWYRNYLSFLWAGVAAGATLLIMIWRTHRRIEESPKRS